MRIGMRATSYAILASDSSGFLLFLKLCSCRSHLLLLLLLEKLVEKVQCLVHIETWILLAACIQSLILLIETHSLIDIVLLLLC